MLSVTSVKKKDPVAPQQSKDQVLASKNIGINMNGRRNGQYYTSILAWDAAKHPCNL